MYNSFMQLKESFYKSNTNVKPSKKWLAYLMDFFFTMVISVFLYGICSLVVNTFGVTKTTQNQAMEVEKKLYQYVDDTHLLYHTNNNLVDKDIVTERIIKANVLYRFSLSEETKDKLTSSVYNGFKPLDLKSNIDGDGLYYYYNVFKPTNIESFNEIEISSEFNYVKDVLNNNEKNYFELSEIGEFSYPLINLETANKLDEYFRNSNYTTGKEIYDYLFELFNNKIDSAIKEVVTYYTPYVDANHEHELLVNKMLNIRGNTLLFSYLLSVIISYLVLPLIFKQGKTLGFKVFKMTVVTKKEYEPSIINVLLNFVLAIISNFSFISLDAFLLFGGESRYFFSVNLLGFVNIFIMGGISLLFAILSVIYMFANKKTHSNIEEFILSREIKDLNETNIEHVKSSEKETYEAVEEK